MLKKLIFVLCITIVGASCLKENDRTCGFPIISVTAPQPEQDSVAAYLDSNNIDAQKHPAGFYYQIINPGVGTDTMTLCSEVRLDYKHRLKNGQVVEQGNDIYIVLGPSIEGWKKGLPLIKTGGEIRLFIPPSLAYG